MSDNGNSRKTLWTRGRQSTWLRTQGDSFDLDPGRRFSIYLLRRITDRIFFNAPDGILLKGGLAGRFRTADARFTTDIDLHAIDQELAIAHVLDSMMLDLEDGIIFEKEALIRKEKPCRENATKEIATLKLKTTWGGKVEKNPIKIEIVQEPPALGAEAPRPGLLLPPSELPLGKVLLYPLVFQIAQKVCGSIELKNGHPSSRGKDLVDLCLIALTESIDRRDLLQALTVEFENRGISWPANFSPPDSMRTSYREGAANSRSTALPRSFEAAKDLASRFLWLEEPSAPDLKWNPENLRWE